MGSDSQPEDQGVTAGLRLTSVSVSDPAVQASMQPWIPLECVQLGRGPQVGEMDTLDFGGKHIVRERQVAAVQKLGSTPQDRCTISCCTFDPTFHFSEIGAAASDTVFFMPGGTEFDIFVPAGAQTHYVSFSESAFLEGARALDPEGWERDPHGISVISAARQADLEALLRRWLEAAPMTAPADPVTLRRRLLHDVLRVATAGPEESRRPTTLDRSRAHKVCRTARDYVEEQLAQDERPSLVDICARVGVSRRTLQYAFRAYADMSPIAYLRVYSLNRVRAVLRTSDPHETTVTEVAMRFGFFHLSRFAGDYARLFGELPSRTLMAARSG